MEQERLDLVDSTHRENRGNYNLPPLRDSKEINGRAFQTISGNNFHQPDNLKDGSYMDTANTSPGQNDIGKKESFSKFKPPRATNRSDIRGNNYNMSFLTNPNTVRNKNNNQTMQGKLITIGAGIIHGPSYINVYHNPVVNFSSKKRSLSRATKARKAKKGHVAGRQLNDQLNDQSFLDDKSANVQTAQGHHQSHGTDPLDTIVNDDGKTQRDKSPLNQDSIISENTQHKSHHRSNSQANLQAAIRTSRHNRAGSLQTISIMGINSMTQARKLRMEKDLQTKQLYNRISILQAEEEKAVKKIQETRIKAQQMLEYKIQQEQVKKERFEQNMNALNRARDMVNMKREEHLNVQIKQKMVFESKYRGADAVRWEANQHRKKIEKNERKYLRKAQEKRFELQVMNEASKIRHEQFLVNQCEGQKRQREDALLKESRQIVKKEKEAKKLELLEAEVMKRLRDTHLRQQQAIEEIQDIFNKRDLTHMYFDPITQKYVQNEEGGDMTPNNFEQMLMDQYQEQNDQERQQQQNQDTGNLSYQAPKDEALTNIQSEQYQPQVTDPSQQQNIQKSEYTQGEGTQLEGSIQRDGPNASKFDKETIGTNENVQGSVITYEERGDRASAHNQSVGAKQIGLQNVATSGTGIQQIASDINEEKKNTQSQNQQLNVASTAQLEERDDIEGQTEQVDDYRSHNRDYLGDPNKINLSKTDTDRNDMDEANNTVGFKKMQHNLLQEENQKLTKSGTVIDKKKVTMEDKKSSQQDYNKTIEPTKGAKLMDSKSDKNSQFQKSQTSIKK